MKDFTFQMYDNLLSAIISNGYECIPYKDYITRQDSLKKFVILRHDVDGRPGHSLKFARMQYAKQAIGTYYFRNVSASYDEKIILEIASMNHEIGFHYEDLSQCHGNYVKAIKKFDKFLRKLRLLYPISTICMHGSPLSRYDNRKIWNRYDYREFGIIGEPYFDTNFSEVWYITDTGRGWNNKTSIRDHVRDYFKIRVTDSQDLISLFNSRSLPDKIMINIHPQRWTDNRLQWYRELVTQRMKNVVKGRLNALRARPALPAL